MENTTFQWVIIQNLLENIKQINDLLSLHIEGGSSPLIIAQYEARKDEFIKELNQVLSSELQLRIRKSVKKTPASNEKKKKKVAGS